MKLYQRLNSVLWQAYNEQYFFVYRSSSYEYVENESRRVTK